MVGEIGAVIVGELGRRGEGRSAVLLA